MGEGMKGRKEIRQQAAGNKQQESKPQGKSEGTKR
jgi:hypothetical protein